MLSQLRGLQAKAYPSNGTTWPAQQSKLLESVSDSAVHEQAANFFLALLHPDPVQRITAAQAVELAFVC